MLRGQPSLTALGAARLRAAHQLLDGGSILADPLALRILGSGNQTSLDFAQSHAAGPRLRWFIAARARIAEDALNVAASRGARQLVVLGAGLDTLAYRTPLAADLRIFEVDHPATQAWKREMLSTEAIPVPDTLNFVPVDFERETLEVALRAAGFDPDLRTFFSWLGVAPYLSEQAMFSTLGFVAGLPGGADIVFDYVNPIASLTPAGREAHRALSERVAGLGESLQTYFETDRLCEKLRAIGFSHLEDVGLAELAARFFPPSERSAPARGGHIMHAATI